MNERRSKHALRLAAAVLCAATMARGAEPPSPAPQAAALDAFFNGRVVQFRPVHSLLGRDLKLGPWNLGERHREKPSDHDPNLYLVVPGSQHSADGFEWLNHNRVLATLPSSETPRSWDVYWAIVLDPTLDMDYRSERELLVAAQEEFRPPDDFSIDKLAVKTVLNNFLKVHTVEDLAPYRRANGTLPGILLVSTGYAVRASVIDSNPPTQTSRSRE